MKLTYIDANGATKVQDGPAAELAVGRARDAFIPLEDEKASRTHCALRFAEDGTLFLQDLGSRNGTFLNGQKLAPRAETALHVGNVFSAGRTQFALLRAPDGLRLKASPLAQQPAAPVSAPAPAAPIAPAAAPAANAGKPVIRLGAKPAAGPNAGKPAIRLSGIRVKTPASPAPAAAPQAAPVPEAAPDGKKKMVIKIK
jgi:hypothetical protein